MFINLPYKLSRECQFYVFRRVGNNYWFYGRYWLLSRAQEVANEIDGVIFHQSDVKWR